MSGKAKKLEVTEEKRWKYIIDKETGLKILKSQKDFDALERVRQIADELFVDREVES